MKPEIGAPAISELKLFSPILSRLFHRESSTDSSLSSKGIKKLNGEYMVHVSDACYTNKPTLLILPFSFHTDNPQTSKTIKALKVCKRYQQKSQSTNIWFRDSAQLIIDNNSDHPNSTTEKHLKPNTYHKFYANDLITKIFFLSKNN